MRAEWGEAVFHIDDHFQIVVQHGADVQTPVDGRHVAIQLPDYDTRLTRLRLLVKLKAKLDAEEFPGR